MRIRMLKGAALVRSREFGNVTGTLMRMTTPADEWLNPSDEWATRIWTGVDDVHRLAQLAQQLFSRRELVLGGAACARAAIPGGAVPEAIQLVEASEAWARGAGTADAVAPLLAAALQEFKAMDPGKDLVRLNALASAVSIGRLVKDEPEFGQNARTHCGLDVGMTYALCGAAGGRFPQAEGVSDELYDAKNAELAALLREHLPQPTGNHFKEALARSLAAR